MTANDTALYNRSAAADRAFIRNQRLQRRAFAVFALAVLAMLWRCGAWTP